MRCATAANIHQSGLTAPGGSRNWRWRETQRSELVTEPSFSPQAAAGNRTCASTVVSVSAMQSDTTTRSHLRKAARTRSAFGMLTTGLVPAIHTAFTVPE